jgi:hypothetical protein
MTVTMPASVPRALLEPAPGGDLHGPADEQFVYVYRRV